MNSPSEINPPEEQPHATCHATHAALRADLSRALADRDRRATADEHVGRAIRRLAQPGAKRRTIRIDELRVIIADADQATPATDTRDLTIAALRAELHQALADRDQRATQATCGHCLGEPPTNHQCPACGRTA